jgi:hypothetical protein
MRLIAAGLVVWVYSTLFIRTIYKFQRTLVLFLTAYNIKQRRSSPTERFPDISNSYGLLPCAAMAMGMEDFTTKEMCLDLLHALKGVR